MSASPHFWRAPFTYLRWASHNRPAFFWSSAIASLGPIFLVATPPIRRYLGDGPRPEIPHTYPIPAGPRKIPEGYDD